jgi:hypothetical protein
MKAKDIQRIEDLKLSQNTEAYFIRNHFEVEYLIAIARKYYLDGHYYCDHAVTPDGKNHLVSKERVIELVNCVKALGLIREDLSESKDFASKIDRFYSSLASNASRSHIMGDITSENNPYVREPYHFSAKACNTKTSKEYNELYESYVPIGAEYMAALKGALASRLTVAEYDVVMTRWGFESGVLLNIEEVAKRLHVSRERIRQIDIKVPRKLSLNFGFPRFSELFGDIPDTFVEVKLPDQPEVITEDTDIKWLGFAVRTYNCLIRGGIRTVKDIASCEDLTKVKYLGRSNIREIAGTMVKLGYERFGSMPI